MQNDNMPLFIPKTSKVFVFRLLLTSAWSTVSSQLC